jgi:hypothetical protein
MAGLAHLASFDITHSISRRRAMKIGYVAAFALLIATPALAASTKTDNGVTIECVVTGSDKDGFDLTGETDGKSEKHCTASCQLTQNDGKKTKEYEYSNRPLGKRTGKQALGGEAGLPGKPLKNPDVTKASCK